MPLLAAFVSAIFVRIFTWVSVSLSFKMAMMLAVAATAVAAIAAFKAALAAIWSVSALVMPAGITVALTLIAPDNFTSLLSLFVVVDIIVASFDYWLLTAGLVTGSRIMGL